MNDQRDSKKDTRFCELYDIIGSSSTTDEQQRRAWQQLLFLENTIGYTVLIAAKYSWRDIPDKYKEKAWQELLKRGIQKDELNLYYLSTNAPEPWNERARKLTWKLQENKK